MQKKREKMSHRCCSKQKVKRGLWSPEEDEKLLNYITIHGGQHGSWSSVPKLAGLERCGKSCRLRWTNYLRPEVKRGSFSAEEEEIIIDVHRILGNRWAQIAKHLPGRTDNEVKNFWNSCIKKKLIAQGLDPSTHNLISYSSSSRSNNVHHQPQTHFHLQHFSLVHSQDQQHHSINNMAMITSSTDGDANPFCWNLNHQNIVNGAGVGDDDEIIFPSKSASSAVSSLSSTSSINNVINHHSSMQFGVLNDVWGSSTTTPAAALPVSSSLPLIQPPTSAMVYDHDQIIHQQQQEQEQEQGHYYYYQLMKMGTQQLQLEPGQTKMDTTSYDHDMTMLGNICSFDDDQLMDSIISASGMNDSISMDDFIACNYKYNF